MAKQVTSRRGMIPTVAPPTKGNRIYTYTGLKHRDIDILVADISFDDSIVGRDVVFSPCRKSLTMKIEDLKGFTSCRVVKINVTNVVGEANV